MFAMSSLEKGIYTERKCTVSLKSTLKSLQA